jgi:hypothetical protein
VEEEVVGWGRTEKGGLENEKKVGNEEINRLNYTRL